MKGLIPQIFYNRAAIKRNEKLKKRVSSQLSFQELKVSGENIKKTYPVEKTGDFIQITVGDIKLSIPQSTDVSEIINLVKGLK